MTENEKDKIREENEGWLPQYVTRDPPTETQEFISKIAELADQQEHFKSIEECAAIRSGIELIAEERQEQIEKHGFTPDKDREYTNGQLLKAAQFCLNPKREDSDWPQDWSTKFKYKIRQDSRVEQLSKAGAFYMAENLRRGDFLYQPEIDMIAAEIDKLQSLESNIISIEKCPECLQPTSADELKMFGGLCEDCTNPD